MYAKFIERGSTIGAGSGTRLGYANWGYGIVVVVVGLGEGTWWWGKGFWRLYICRASYYSLDSVRLWTDNPVTIVHYKTILTKVIG